METATATGAVVPMFATVVIATRTQRWQRSGPHTATPAIAKGGNGPSAPRGNAARATGKLHGRLPATTLLMTDITQTHHYRQKELLCRQRLRLQTRQ